MLKTEFKGSWLSLWLQRLGSNLTTYALKVPTNQVSAAIVKCLRPLASRVKTITYDNDKEFAGHKAIDQFLGSTAYFADPFAS